MWDHGRFTAKAKLYFGRAEDSYEADDNDQSYLWLLLGFEFLLRAPLAKASPVLLAAHDQNSALHAAGINIGNESPRSLATSLVAKRLAHLVDGFRIDQIQKDVNLLTNIRNEELHTASSPLRNVPTHKWLPKFMHVVSLLATHLGETVSDYIPEQIIAHAEHLKDVEDKAIRAEVAKLIAKHKDFAENLKDDEVNNRKIEYPRWIPTADCPACGIPGKLTFSTVHRSREHIEDDQIISEERQITTGFECTVCGLALESAAQLHAADLYETRDTTNAEDIAEKYADYFESSYEYGGSEYMDE